MSTLSKRQGTVRAALCRCGCARLILYLRVPPDIDDPTERYRTVPCYADGWDGNVWYTKQVRRHPRKGGRPAWPPPVDPDLQLE